MLESIEFTNFKALRKTTLPLAPFTLLLGPNGSGKSSVLQALRIIAAVTSQVVSRLAQTPGFIAGSAIGQCLAQITSQMASQPGTALSSLLSVSTDDREAGVEIKLRLRLKEQLFVIAVQWHSNAQITQQLGRENGEGLQPAEMWTLVQWLGRIQAFTLDSFAISQPIAVNSGPLQPNGAGLAAVLDDLKDSYPERWELVLAEMRRWLPEYDYILFDKPQPGQKGIVLRTKKGGHRIPARDLSQGTLIGLALLTLAYLPNPPSLVALEEIDRGLHPWLLRNLQDALYRLSYPESCGETRPATQVIATTHSPYLLDMYREHPEEVVLAQKEGLEVKMNRLTDIDHFQDILGDSPLSEVWYSGVLGGVPVKP